MYNYANNNPIIFVDPMGHAIFIGLLVGIVATGSAIIGNTIYQNKKAKQQINKVQKKTNIPDMTKEINKMLKKNAKDVIKDTKNMNPLKKLDYFIENVDNGKKYDLKLTDEWKGKTVSYDGIIMEAQDIGNFNFGYIGRALGYDTEFLTFGAGINQELNKNRYTPWCFTLSFCDDPRDSYYIRMGAIKYDNEN